METFVLVLVSILLRGLFSQEKLIEWKLGEAVCFVLYTGRLFSQEKLIEWKHNEDAGSLLPLSCLFSQEKLIEWKQDITSSVIYNHLPSLLARETN